VSTARAAARRFVGRSYAASKQYALLRMRRTAPPVVVFSMGKTGSTAIARAVQAATGDRVFQVFRLDAERLAQAEARYRASHERGAPFRGASHLWESEYLLRRPPTAKAPWTVITTVREPVAQAVSAFFHGRGGRDLLGRNPSVDALLDDLVAERWVREPLRWFDREFAPGLGVDVFAEAFDPRVGHGLIETPAVRVLLLRQESLDAAPGALARLLGLDRPVPVPVRNDAGTKGYAAGYRAFLSSVRIPEPVLDEAYDSRYARHFYADDEMARFRDRWLKAQVGE
jgi:hypothetical protein